MKAPSEKWRKRGKQEFEVILKGSDWSKRK